MKDEVWNLNSQLFYAIWTGVEDFSFKFAFQSFVDRSLNDIFEFFFLFFGCGNDCNQSDFLCSRTMKQQYELFSTCNFSCAVDNE